jgi:hypothetical protein
MKSEVKITENRIHITRIFNAPRSVVFGYFTQAEKLQLGVEQGKQTKVVRTQDGLPDQQHCEIISEGTTGGMEKLDALLALLAA